MILDSLKSFEKYQTLQEGFDKVYQFIRKNNLHTLEEGKHVIEERMERAKKALEAVGLGERLEHKPMEMSGGQRQRVAIARALINNPAIIMADEPTGNLDTKSSYEIMDIFKKMNESGKTVVMVTHEPDIAEQTKRILVMRDGQLVSDERSGGKTDYAAIELQQMRDGTQS